MRYKGKANEIVVEKEVSDWLFYFSRIPSLLIISNKGAILYLVFHSFLGYIMGEIIWPVSNSIL